MSKKTSKSEAPKKLGRPFEHPDEETANQVESLSAMGASQESIADFLSIDDETLRTHYSSALKQGGSRVSNRLRIMQLKKAYSGNTGMLIWLGKQLLGQSEKYRHGDWDEADNGFKFVKGKKD